MARPTGDGIRSRTDISNEKKATRKENFRIKEGDDDPRGKLPDY
jgi:hypothetical protein